MHKHLLATALGLSLATLAHGETAQESWLHRTLPAETAAKYGDEQVHIWRRSFDVPPPAIDKTSEHYPANDRRYQEVPAAEMPVGESLKDTIARVLPYWDSNIAPELRQGKNVLISAHGNSLRALIKYLMNISDEKILELNLPTGTPLIFDLDDNLNIVSAPELF